MKLQISCAILLLLAMVVFAGCYTQLGYHASSNYGRVHHTHQEGLTKEEAETEHTNEAASEDSELEHADDKEDSKGYYGRRKRSYRTTYTSPYRYDAYWVPYGPYPYYYASPPVWYYPYRPFYGRYYYGYRAPYYRYYSGYYPYRNVYRRYHSGSRYVPLSRRTYKKGSLRVENRRSRSSRSVTSPSSRSKRQQIRDRNRK